MYMRRIWDAEGMSGGLQITEDRPLVAPAGQRWPAGPAGISVICMSLKCPVENGSGCRSQPTSLQRLPACMLTAALDPFCSTDETDMSGLSF